MKNDLDVIKYRFGERMMKLCRDELYKLLEVPGLLPKLLDQYFAKQKFLAEDIILQSHIQSFKDFLYNKANLTETKCNVDRNKKAAEILAEKGYHLYPECLTEKDIQSFRHYFYRPDGKKLRYNEGEVPEHHVGEELCTFNGGRLLGNRIWFAIHKDAEKLKREDFTNPQRQDKYGTSVLCIQFTKNEYSTLSIKNRYNDSVYNPDNTFNNNLDNISPGLSVAFERDYGVSDKMQTERCNFELDGYVMASDGKFYPYNYNINNVYYCPNNIIIDSNKVKPLPTHQFLLDYFIIDLKTKEVRMYDNSHYDSFIDVLGENQSIKIEKNGVIKITKKDGGVVTITFNSRNQIEKIKDDSLRQCGEQYLAKSQYIKEINLPEVQECLSGFLYYNNSIEILQMPKLRRCYDFFMYSNEVLTQINLPSLLVCGDSFFYSNNLKFVKMPQLQKCGHDFLYFSPNLTEVNFPRLRECGNNFLGSYNFLNKFEAPNLKICGDDFLHHNEKIEVLTLPRLQMCGNGFMAWNKSLTELSLPKLLQCGENFLYHNTLSKEPLRQKPSKLLRHFQVCLERAFKLKNKVSCCDVSTIGTR